MNTRHFTALLVFLLLALFGLQGCGEDEPVVYVDMTKRQEVRVPEALPAITYAYLPQYSHTVSYRRHNPLIEYIAAETGLSLRQVFPDTFEEHRRMVERGDIDISFSNPFTYVSIAKTGARAFARIVEPSGSTNFRGQIIARTDNLLIQNLQDCRGKRWIAVDPLSAGGYLFALGHFLDHGIHPEDFAEIAFAPGPGGKQEKAVLAVYAGKYDIASIREGTLDVVKDKIDPERLRIVATTRDYPGWVYAARKGLPQEVVKAIADALFKLSMQKPEHAAILAGAGMSRIIPATDRDYEPIRELVAKTRFNEAAYDGRQDNAEGAQ
ncbi:phosphate/phosphite/phosphonate ABC transporter substrate-binding protein [Desulfovibrio mangrovi]|uniref:phosphate/phosphite/phosphonate ABC transporter substrate-binding protein n=1 Tax=Desulfovibrio mangrovi TaxID=2976983 RepID=UPI0022477F1E|nr:phosphate/phosphite/phosphonate ABC transporter substrate-binding protein [Desulfovibrio mangrovi]UZP66102.1 phosphate/phosphite/phosphonate ABC transporter substrate-binding protein [Desulfovibrio mangrovi]